MGRLQAYKLRFLEIVRFRCHKPRQETAKTELQIALAAATSPTRRPLEYCWIRLSNLAYKAIKKNGEFVVPGFRKLVKQKRKARTRINPKTQQQIKIPAKTVLKFRVTKGGKGRDSGGKEVVSRVPRSVPSSQPLSQRHRAFQHSWRLDETYCRVKGKWVYLYRAVDSTGATEIKSSEFGDNIIVVKKDIPLAIPHITMEQNFQCRG